MAPPTRLRGGGWSVRIRYGSDLRGRFRLPHMSEAEATDRAQRLERMARILGEAGLNVEARELLRRGAAERSSKLFERIEAKASELAAAADPEAKRVKVKTFRDVCELWWSGELHRMAPDRVSKCTPESMAQGRARLGLLCKTVGNVPLTKFTLDTAERALAALPSRLAPLTRRQYALRLSRILKLAALPPLRVIEHSPIPSGWAPAKGPRRAYPFLYPDEDKQLLRSAEVELEHRYLWGFLAREGCRINEARKLKWSDIDLARGVINLDRNKTRTPRTWRLCIDVTRALGHKRHAEGGGEGDRVFHVHCTKPAKAFRADLRVAGVLRPDMHKRTAERSWIRVHDLRGSFVTLALANGKTEAWVMDRTGHTTSAMLNQYRRQARFAAELGLGWYGPMDELLGVSGHDRDSADGSGPETSVVPETSSSEAADEEIARQAISALEVGPRNHSGTPVPATIEHPGHTSGAVKKTLEAALQAAAEAGEWEVARRLLDELERRRGRE